MIISVLYVIIIDELLGPGSDVALIVVCSLLFAALVTLFVLVYRLVRKRKAVSPAPTTLTTAAVMTPTAVPTSPKPVPLPDNKLTWRLEPRDLDFSPEDVHGQGSLGTLHRGKLKGSFVAVKRVQHTGKTSELELELKPLMYVPRDSYRF